MKEQITIDENINEGFDRLANEYNLHRFLLVCGRSLDKYEVGRKFKSDENIVAVFSDFSSNPTYESIRKGIECFNMNSCNAIIAIGGGSTIDVAKSIKGYISISENKSTLSMNITDSGIFLATVPTTAGTGSEANQFAVFYYNGEKQSADEEYLLPDVVMFDASLISGLSDYQRKVSMLDAFAHSVESIWSIRSVEENRKYAREALKIIFACYRDFLAGESEAASKMLIAANLAGKAINITRTTAPHAMSYKLTTTYGIAHGGAVSLCLGPIFRYTYEQAVNEKDRQLLDKLTFIAESFGVCSVDDAISKYEDFTNEIGIKLGHHISKKELDMLTESVNADRLKMHPVNVPSEVIRTIYAGISKQ